MEPFERRDLTMFKVDAGRMTIWMPKDWAEARTEDGGILFSGPAPDHLTLQVRTATVRDEGGGLGPALREFLIAGYAGPASLPKATATGNLSVIGVGKPQFGRVCCLWKLAAIYESDAAAADLALSGPWSDKAEMQADPRIAELDAMLTRSEFRPPWADGPDEEPMRTLYLWHTLSLRVPLAWASERSTDGRWMAFDPEQENPVLWINMEQQEIGTARGIDEYAKSILSRFCRQLPELRILSLEPWRGDGVLVRAIEESGDGSDPWRHHRIYLFRRFGTKALVGQFRLAILHDELESSEAERHLSLFDREVRHAQLRSPPEDMPNAFVDHFPYTDLKTIDCFGGCIRLRVPARWTCQRSANGRWCCEEEDDEEGSATLWVDFDAMALGNDAPDENSRAALAEAMLDDIASGGREIIDPVRFPRPHGLILRYRYDGNDENDGLPLVFHRWHELKWFGATFVLVHYSLVILARYADLPPYRELVDIIDREVKRAEISLPPT